MLEDLAIQNGYVYKKLLEVLAVITDDLTINLVADCLMGGHLCELTAMSKVKAMEPVVLYKDGGLYHSRTDFTMVDYMEDMGISPAKAMQLVSSSYENARKEASSKGINDPALPNKTNEWDCYYTIAMVFSDYWITVGEDISKAATMAYEILSDTDG